MRRRALSTFCSGDVEADNPPDGADFGSDDGETAGPWCPTDTIASQQTLMLANGFKCNVAGRGQRKGARRVLDAQLAQSASFCGGQNRLVVLRPGSPAIVRLFLPVRPGKRE